jgi:hypothetical protein
VERNTDANNIAELIIETEVMPEPAQIPNNQAMHFLQPICVNIAS